MNHAEPGLETATLGGGCFWCVEAVLAPLRGVHEVVSGYAGGHVPDPGYRAVCGGGTGHAEVAQVRFDPAVISYRDLLRVFFATHDPTTLNRQGADTGTQYRSVVFHHSPEQAATAAALIAEFTAERVWDDPIVTELAPAPAFYPAEPEHQDYYARNAGQPYCRVVISPKVAKLRSEFADRIDETRQ